MNTEKVKQACIVGDKWQLGVEGTEIILCGKRLTKNTVKWGFFTQSPPPLLHTNFFEKITTFPNPYVIDKRPLVRKTFYKVN